MTTRYSEQSLIEKLRCDEEMPTKFELQHFPSALSSKPFSLAEAEKQDEQKRLGLSQGAPGASNRPTP